MPRFPLFCLALAVSLCSALSADEYSPAIAPASDEGRLAMSGFKLPEGVVVKLWAAEPLLANPVCFCFDEQGRAYVCETFRQKHGVEDDRGHMNWLEDDLALQTVEQRGEMFKKYLGDKAVPEYGREQDRIRLLADTDGDGVADKSTLFAAGFNDILDGTGAGVLAIDSDVYFTCIPDLYLLRDTSGDGRADEKTSLAHGFGVRVAFRGHDLHGLTLGPDGRIYFSLGDRGYNVVTKEGAKLIAPDRGAVFRCERDGSGLEVFAEGLRNPQELAFDDYGNLFTGDNNSDSGDQARWVYVVEGGDSGWRMYFQYLQDRGPWNRERMWHPYKSDDKTAAVQPAYIVPPILNISDGPSGVTHYPGLGLDDRYRDHFFLVDFRGQAGNSGVRSFAMDPSGASFKLTDSHWFLQSILATDVDFGYDGRMYVSDWVDGWDGAGKGRLYSFTDEKHHGDPRIAEAQQLMQSGFRELDAAKLSALLAHADRRIRQRAQLELARRGAAALLEQTAKSGPLLARLHAVWGLGQLLRAGKGDARFVIALLQDSEPEVRAQAIRVLGDARIAAAAEGLIDRVGVGTPREQALAAIALGRLRAAGAAPALVELLAVNADADPVVRHSAALGLAGVASPEQLQDEFRHPSRSVRLGIVLALRRHQSPLLEQFLSDPDMDVALEAARAVHELPVATALPALAALPVNGATSNALARRTMNANFRLGGEQAAERVAGMAANERLDATLRAEAIQELLRWDQPPVLDRVTNEFRPVPARPVEQAQAAVRAQLPGMLSGSEKIVAEALKLAGKYKITEIGGRLMSILNDAQAPVEARREALAALAAIGTKDLDALLDQAVEDSQPQVRALALKFLAQRQPEKAIPRLLQAVASGARVEAQSAAATLGDLKSEGADKAIAEAFDLALAGKLPGEVQLDLLLAGQRRTSDAVRERLARYEAGRTQNDPLAQYRECLLGGDADRGRDVFFGNAAASCRRCHKINGDGGEVGPDLSAVAKDKPREYLLESIVLPNAKIAKGFESVVFALADGRVVSGIIKGEDAAGYRLMKPTGEVVTIARSDVEEQAKGKSGMPEDLVKQLSKSDIRDLVEYLSTLQTPASGAEHR